MSPGPARPPLLPGTMVRDQGGAPIGRVMHLFHDPVTGHPEWASLARSTGGRWLLVPLAGSTLTPTGVVLAHPQAAVLAGPTAPDGKLGYRDQLNATTYYYGPATPGGVPDTTQPLPQDPTPAAGRDPAAAATPPGPAVTAHDGPEEVVLIRSEEQLRTSTETVVARRVRVRKVVVTEERTITVQVRREELQIDSVPVDDPNPVPGDLATVAPAGGDDLLITLHVERPVVTLDVVPVEHIRVVTDTVVEDRTVQAPVRREVVDFPDTSQRGG